MRHFWVLTIFLSACLQVPDVRTSSHSPDADAADDGRTPDVQTPDLTFTLDMSRADVVDSCDGSSRCTLGEACDGVDDNGNEVIDEFCPGVFSLGARFFGSPDNNFNPTSNVSCPERHVVVGVGYELINTAEFRLITIECRELVAWTDGTENRFLLSGDPFRVESDLINPEQGSTARMGTCDQGSVGSSLLVEGIVSLVWAFGMRCAEFDSDDDFSFLIGDTSHEPLGCNNLPGASCRDHRCPVGTVWTGVAWDGVIGVNEMVMECAPIVFD